jgi:hypothetical protein
MIDNRLPVVVLGIADGVFRVYCEDNELLLFELPVGDKDAMSHELRNLISQMIGHDAASCAPTRLAPCAHRAVIQPDFDGSMLIGFVRSSHAVAFKAGDLPLTSQSVLLRLAGAILSYRLRLTVAHKVAAV